MTLRVHSEFATVTFRRQPEKVVPPKMSQAAM
jgi:hypothetical protein